MGSGFIMHSYALTVLAEELSDEEIKEALEAIGTEFLINVFGSDTYEDFISYSKRGAELVAKAMKQNLLNNGWTEQTCSVDVIEIKQHDITAYKVAFFK